MLRGRLLCLALWLSLPASLAAQALPAGLADAIRQEATRPNRGEVGRPLPLAAHWNVTGMYMQGLTPAYQLHLLNKGHHVLPFALRPANDNDAQAVFELFLNGDKLATGQAPLLGVHTGDINLGRSGSTRFHDQAADNPGYNFAGRLDDFRIANRSFTAEEVRALANPGK